MDPIFDRLGRLIRSWSSESEGPSSHRTAQDPLEREAEEELEEFLRTGRERPRPGTGTQGQKSYQESRRTHQEAPRPQVDPVLAGAYATLGLSPGASWDAVHGAHRTLLKQHHPDNHSGNEAKMREATVESQRINEAFQVLKKHLGR